MSPNPNLVAILKNTSRWLSDSCRVDSLEPGLTTLGSVRGCGRDEPEVRADWSSLTGTFCRVDVDVDAPRGEINSPWWQQTRTIVRGLSTPRDLSISGKCFDIFALQG